MQRDSDIETPLSLNDLLNLHDQVISFFTVKWEEAERNEKRFLGRNWTAEQEAEIEAQDRYPYSFPLAMTKINTIRSVMRESRVNARIEATIDPNDQIKAELATLQIKDVEKRNDFQALEADVMDLGLAVHPAVTKTYIDTKGIYPEVIVKSVDYKNFVWDINAISHDLSDKKDGALWVAEIEKSPRKFAENEYDLDLSEEIEDSTNWGREKLSYYINRADNKENDIISIFHHYQRVERDYYCVIFPDTEQIYGITKKIVARYKSKQEAQSHLIQLNMPYMMAGIPPEGNVIKKKYQAIDHYQFTYYKMLNYEELDFERFPYAQYFGVKMMNDYASFLTFLSSPQLFFDRLWAQIDYSLGTDLKKVTEVNESNLSSKHSVEDVIKVAEDGGVLFKKSPENLFNLTEGKGVNPQVFEIAGILQSYLEDFTGGRSFQGLKEQSNESGVAIQAKQKQGLLIATILWDNFKRWKKSQIMNVIEYLRKYETYERTIKVIGGALTPQMVQILQAMQIYLPGINGGGDGYVKIYSSQNKMTYLDDFEFELSITEDELTDTERMTKYLMVVEAEQQDPNLRKLPSWMMLKLRYMDIPEYDRQMIMQEYQNMLGMQAQAQQMEQSRTQRGDQQKERDSDRNYDLERQKLLLQAKQYGAANA